MQHHTTFDYRRQQYIYRSICQPSLQICLARTAWNRTSQAPPTWWCDEESGFVFLLSRLDNYNSLLAGLPENRLDRLQRVENNAARPVLGRRGRDHKNLLPRSLHWLPIRARIEYKISTLCYRSRDLSAPAYVSHLLAVSQPSLSLHSADAVHGLVTDCSTQ